MHWFGELLAIYIAIALFAGLPLEVRLLQTASANPRAARLNYTRQAAWQKSWRLLDDANAAAIAAIETGQAPGFPDDIMDQMIAAHSAAREVKGNKK